MNLYILSGRSGAGKSVALRVMEDLGYYCVDNLPLEMVPQLVKSRKGINDTIAISLDIRNLPLERIDIPRLKRFFGQGVNIQLFFLDSSDDILIRRYSETRRIHPLSRDGLPLAEAIAEEHRQLSPLIQYCDHHICTDNLSVHQLAEVLRSHLSGSTTEQMMLQFESFGFKHGMPRQADYLFDARFLPNPHWDPDLKVLTGKNAPVKTFFESHESVGEFIDSVEAFLQKWLPDLDKNNRAYLTVAIGCTGGQHRSVYIADELAERFTLQRNNVRVKHRELAHSV